MSTTKRKIKQIINEVLSRHRVEDLALEIDLVDALHRGLYPGMESKQSVEERKAGTLAAMARGADLDYEIKQAVEKAFRIYVNWDAKGWTALLRFLKQRPTDETVEKFSAWWKNSWMGRDGTPPQSPEKIMLNWPQAFSEMKTSDPAAVLCVDEKGGFNV